MYKDNVSLYVSYRLHVNDFEGQSTNRNQGPSALYQQPPNTATDTADNMAMQWNRLNAPTLRPILIEGAPRLKPSNVVSVLSDTRRNTCCNNNVNTTIMHDKNTTSAASTKDAFRIDLKVKRGPSLSWSRTPVLFGRSKTNMPLRKHVPRKRVESEQTTIVTFCLTNHAKHNSRSEAVVNCL